MDKTSIFFSEEEKKQKNYYQNKCLLENIIRNSSKININEETTTSNLFAADNTYDKSGFFDLLALSLSKRVFDRIRSRWLVGVQPMPGPVGVYYALRCVADQAYSGDNLYGTSMTELGYNNIDSTYSGSYELSAGETIGSKDGSGVSDDIGLGLGDGTHIKDVSISIEKKKVEAKTRKLRSRISIEVLQDIFHMHNVDLQNEILNALAKEISAEIDMEIIEKIESVAESSNLDYSTISSGMGTNRSDINNSFITYVIDKCNEIGVSTNHGVGNFVIASPNISTILESTSSFSFAKADDERAKDGLSFAGHFNGKRLYRNIFWTDDKFLVGYKGRTELDAGIFYLPYIQTYLSGGFDDSFNKSYGILSRYAIGDSIFGSNNYYRLINLQNFSI